MTKHEIMKVRSDRSVVTRIPDCWSDTRLLTIDTIKVVKLIIFVYHGNFIIIFECRNVIDLVELLNLNYVFRSLRRDYCVSSHLYFMSRFVELITNHFDT